MYGLFYYGIEGRHLSEKLYDMVKYGSSLDIFDFCHENSPYLPDYEHPLNVAFPELNSGSTPSVEEVEEVARDERESVADEDASGLGINEYESNLDLVADEDVDVTIR